MNLTGQRVMHGLRAAIFRHLLRLAAAFYDRYAVGRLMTRVLNDVEAVNEAFTSGLFAVIGDIVTLVAVVGAMLWLDWRLALVTFSLVPVLAAVAAWFRIRARDAYREVRRRLARLNAFLQESIQGMSVIQLFAREAHEHRAFRRLNAEYRRMLFRSTIWEASLYASVEALGSAALALLLWYGARQIAAEALTFGTLVAFIQYTNRFFLPIRDLGARRRHVGIIFQDTVLFTGSIETNLQLGLDGHVARADLDRAIDAASCRRLVETLPRGLGEELVERGANLSHGQRQLLAIARALVYNPAVLVLDEATSSVDPESEALIRRALARLVEGRTTITIAHRLSTVQSADRILVLHRGRVQEEGRHADLLRRGGLYARLWELSRRTQRA